MSSCWNPCNRRSRRPSTTAAIRIGPGPRWPDADHAARPARALDWRIAHIDSVERVGRRLVIAGTRTAYHHAITAVFCTSQAPKELWEVPGAGHVDYHRAAPGDYEARVGGFLERHLRDGPGRISPE